MDTRLLYLSKEDVIAAGVSMAEIIDLLEIAFTEKGKNQTEMPPKPGVHPGGGDNFIHAMPAYIPAMKAAGIKWVGGFPSNLKLGLPYITGLLILNDAETGLPVAVMDCVWLTGMRTGAATALSARYLARPDSRVVGILGCGVQGRTNLEALKELFPIEQVKAFDVDADAANHYAQEMQNRLAVDVAVVSEPMAAVNDSDIIVTAGPIMKTPHATIQAGWMKAGAFASLVDFDSYWHPAAMHAAAKFCTDDTAQMLHYKTLGYFKDTPEIHADLGELVMGTEPGREASEERTMTANLGLAIEDMAVAPLIVKKAKEKGVGTWLHL
jgi:ornithine cyclodeaminase/alanine dehydrogenase